MSGDWSGVKFEAKRPSSPPIKREMFTPSPPIVRPSSVRPDPILDYQLKYTDDGRVNDGRKTIDLVFILDCTGSMQKYIDATRDHIVAICDMIKREEGLGGPEDLRMARSNADDKVVNYRDHPPQDHSYVVRTLEFTSDVSRIEAYLRTLNASGGGDGPEAVTAGMAACLTDLVWRPHAAKMVVLIADAPPHGIGERGDQIKTGDPDGHDPLVIARAMAQRGIHLFMVACEETLSGYNRGVEFFQALCNLTSGVMMPLLTADMLAMAIVAYVLENIQVEQLWAELGAEVAARIKEKGESFGAVEEVAQELHNLLLLRKDIQVRQVKLPQVYIEAPEATHNINVWMSANLISEGVDHIKPVDSARLTSSFLNRNRNRGFAYVPGGALPPRKRLSTGPSIGVGTPPNTNMSPPGTPSTADLRTPLSPGRRVPSEFKAFSSPSGAGGSSNMSVFGAPVAKVGPGGGMFGSAGMSPTAGGIRDSRMRGRMGMDDDDEDEEEEDDMGMAARGPDLKTDSVSLDQARRIATQAIFRAGRMG